MSRIGKLPIKVPENVVITYNDPEIKVKGEFGELINTIPQSISITQEKDILIVGTKDQTRQTKALHGLYRSLIDNMVVGVSKQFKKTLILVGVGYRAAVQKDVLTLNLGLSHPVELEIPKSISVAVVKNTTINITSFDKEALGLFSAKVRAWRPPEPYKGKGVLYEGEVVKRKAGKSGKK